MISTPLQAFARNGIHHAKNGLNRASNTAYEGWTIVKGLVKETLNKGSVSSDELVN